MTYTEKKAGFQSLVVEVWVPNAGDALDHIFDHLEDEHQVPRHRVFDVAHVQGPLDRDGDGSTEYPVSELHEFEVAYHETLTNPVALKRVQL